MAELDFLRGSCPYCGGQADMQTKICSDSATCWRNFYPGDRLPILPYNNYYGDALPQTFVWIVRGETICCRNRIATIIRDGIIGPLMRLKALDGQFITIPIYIEKSENDPKRRFAQCIDELRDKAFAHQFNSMSL